MAHPSRWRPGRRAQLGLSSLLLLLLLVLLSVVVARRDLEWDVSQGDRRTLRPQTRQVLELLDRPVHILAFYAESPQERTLLRDLVERYRRHSKLLTLEFVDLDRRPEMARAHDVTVNRTVLLTSGDLEVKLVAPGEAELTGALVRLMRDLPPRVLVLTGHGEASIIDASARGISRAAELLRRQNFRVETFLLQGSEGVPPDVAAVILPSPERSRDDREREMILDYLLRGGHLMAMVEPMGAADVDSLLAGFGVICEPGFVVDATEQRRNLTGGGNFRIALAMGGNAEHPITQGFTFATLFPLARSLGSVQPPLPGVKATRLLQTGLEAWSEQDLRVLAEGTPEFDAGIDRGGPLGLAYAVEVNLRRFQWGETGEGLSSTMLDLAGPSLDLRDSSQVDTLSVGGLTLSAALKEEARLVVVGDVDFVNNANLLVQGNSELFLAMMLWLTEQETRLALAPRPDLSDPIVLTENQRRWIRILGIGLLPGLALLAAGVVLWRRSRWL